MGQYCECDVWVDYTSKVERKKIFIKEVKKKLPDCKITEENCQFNFHSQRENNLQYQLEIFETILKKYSELIELAEGTIFLGIDNFVFEPKKKK